MNISYNPRIYINSSYTDCPNEYNLQSMIIMNAMRIHLCCEERLCLGQNIITKIYYDIKHTKHV